ncbi:hypothetical protein TrRE_jg993, partial [Triparma retinervis]
MSHGVLQVKVSSLTTNTSYPSLSVTVSLGATSLATSKIRHSKGGDDWTEEVLEFDYDTDVHEDTILVQVKGSREIIDEFTISALSSPQTFSGSNSTLTLSTDFVVEHGIDLKKTSYMFPLSYLMVLLMWFVPQHYPVPYQANLLLTTTAVIYLGSHLSLHLRSPDPNGPGPSGESAGEVMTAADAMRFPFVGSAALFGLYCAFKYLDEGWVNYLISFYFTFAGGMAVASSFEPIMQALLPGGLRMTYTLKIPHPLPSAMLGPSPLSFEVSTSGVLSFLAGSLVGHSYFVGKHWTLNNVLGLSFCVQGISMFSIGSYRIAAILLVGLFFYDIFWVFGTPVMVTVAKKLDGPIKLLFPRSLERNEEGKLNLSLLGLGDIVIPGFLISFMLRFDADRARVPEAYNPSLSFPKPYFHCILSSYVVGLGFTLWMMTKFNAAQPALLYLVPATLGSTMGLAWWRGEAGELWEFSEEEELAEEGEKGKTERNTLKKTPVKT